MSDPLRQAADLLTMCLDSQAGIEPDDSEPGGDAGSLTNLAYSENLNVWAVVDARECGGECPVRHRVAQEAGNQFGRILSAHLALELGLLAVACRATGSDPHELLQQVVAETEAQLDSSAVQPAPPDDTTGWGDTTGWEDDAVTDRGDLAEPDLAEPDLAEADLPVPDPTERRPDDGAKEPDSGHVSARHRMLLDHGDLRTE